jgi:hypothetical protein
MRNAVATRVAVELEFTGKRYQRPPEATLFFDATLRNENTAGRWFLLPAGLDVLGGQTGFGVSGIEVFELPGHGRVVLGRFFGTARFQALYLPAGGRVRIRQFSISVAGQPDERVSLEVVIASGLRIGDEAVESWFGMDPACDMDADVSRDQARMLSSRHTPDLHEAPIVAVEEQRLTLKVDIS